MFKTFYVCSPVAEVGGTPFESPWKFAEAAKSFDINEVQNVQDEVWTDIVGHRHLFDEKLGEGNTILGGHITATVRTAVRKVPLKLLNARVEARCLEIQEATGRFPTRQLRREVAAEIKEDLLPAMPLTIDGINFTFDRKSKLLFVEAGSPGKLEKAILAIMAQTKVEFEQITPARMIGASTVDCSLTCSQEIIPVPVAGMDFLTWYFYLRHHKKITSVQRGEREEYTFTIDSLADCAFSGEDEKGRSCTLKISGGNPVLSHESWTALLEGKRLSEATILLGDAKTGFKFVYNYTGRISGLEIYGLTEIAPDEHHEETVNRMVELCRVLSIMYRGLRQVLDEGPEKVNRICLDMHLWARLQSSQRNAEHALAMGDKAATTILGE